MAMVVAVVLIKPPLPDGDKLLDAAVRIGPALVFGLVAQRLLFLVVGRVESWIVRAGKGGSYALQRAHTLGRVLRRRCTVLVMDGVVIRVPAALGWDVGPLLARAGILGVALSLGAQTPEATRERRRRIVRSLAGVHPRLAAPREITIHTTAAASGESRPTEPS